MGINSAKKSGTVLENVLLSYKPYENKPDNFLKIEDGFTNTTKFIRKGAGGSQPDTIAFEATFLMDICHFIQDLKIVGILPNDYDFLYKNATIIERSFSKLGIIAYIEEATGYIYYKKKEEYQELFNKFLNDEADKWQKIFPETFFNMIWKIWLQKKAPIDSKCPGFFGKIIRKYVYQPLAVKKLGLPPDNEGILLFKLDELNPKSERGYRTHRFHQFLNDIGKEELKEHITRLTTIGDLSENKKQFDEHFNKIFRKNEITPELLGINDNEGK